MSSSPTRNGVSRRGDSISSPPSPQASPRVLDIGTGSGAIIVALRKHYTGRGLFFATDIARESLSVARKNAIDNGVADILFLQAPFFDAFAPGQRFDLILSNPPYIDRGGESLLPPEVLTEPDRALFSQKGTLPHRKILHLAPGYLKPGGRLLMETGGPTPAWKRSSGRPLLIQDLSGKTRFIRMDHR